ncbi:MAG: response regulator [Patescibacteria group bacterium]|nr:response regulator [Patescibacteria group bacterium]
MPDQKPSKILVVEDDPAMREIVTHKLVSHGFEVTQAEDGRKALDLFQQNRPDLILLDLMLPEVDGFKVLETIRKNSDQALAKTPVIVLSNLWSSKDILSTQALQIQAYMVKAYFTTEEILNKVKEILTKQRSTAAAVAPPPVSA